MSIFGRIVNFVKGRKHPPKLVELDTAPISISNQGDNVVPSEELTLEQPTQEQNNDFNNSRPINLWLVSDNAEYDHLINQLIEDMRAYLNSFEGEKKTRFRTKEHTIFLYHFLADLFMSFTTDDTRYLAINGGKNWYSNNTRYQPKRFAHSAMVKTIEFLLANKYVEYQKGYYLRPTKEGRIARVKATQKLMTVIKSFGINTSMFYNSQEQECIILKSTKGSKGKSSLIDYTDNDSTIQMRLTLRFLNDIFNKHWIDLRITDSQFQQLQSENIGQDDSGNSGSTFDLSRIYLRRIFNNNSFEHGGRFYHGWWQEIPKDYRAFITISGKRTIELDYSGMHFTMMYALKNLEVPITDHYTVEGVEDRDKAKEALNIAINAPSMKAAIKAINRDVWADESEEIVTGYLDKLLAKHKPISEYFNSGFGVQLQCFDSNIAERVMMRMWQEYRVVVLPIHDSFVVPAGYQEILNVVMIESFTEIIGVDVKLKPKEPKRFFGTSYEKNNRDKAINLKSVTPEIMLAQSSEYSLYEGRQRQWEELSQS